MSGPVDWKNFGGIADAAAKAAAAQTNRELAGELQALTRLTAEQVENLAPTQADKVKLAELMKLVNSAEEHNIKVKRLVANAEEYGELLLKLAQGVAKGVMP